MTLIAYKYQDYGGIVDNIKRMVGERIRDLRKEKGLSQEGLGWKADLHCTYIGAIERGEKNWYIDTLSKVAKGLGIGIKDLLCFNQSVKESNKSKAILINEIKKYSPEVLKHFTNLINALKS